MFVFWKLQHLQHSLDLDATSVLLIPGSIQSHSFIVSFKPKHKQFTVYEECWCHCRSFTWEDRETVVNTTAASHWRGRSFHVRDACPIHLQCTHCQPAAHFWQSHMEELLVSDIHFDCFYETDKNIYHLSSSTLMSWLSYAHEMRGITCLLKGQSHIISHVPCSSVHHFFKIRNIFLLLSISFV